ncbi:ATP-binding cassette domain-containing protein [Periweissella cryptocerci]|uniref:ATP-binding cassette domain-containing protein n=1 Tax=Periweissella cryptocerci TaxID=2506420 RepID=A0A4P6YR86_9LACO|nr:ATP-binding cassette domain-containing protein [Periweissella cryptocerci]QBO35102.1 ATP-binding cassette domain-containing protein [Periweissella cryptocerci]
MKIEVINLEKSFGKHQIISGFSHEFNAGSFTAIKGASGTGKTTLLNMLGLLESADEGEYYLDGKLLKKLTPRVHRNLYRTTFSFVFQDYGLMLNESVQTNLSLATRFTKNKRHKNKQAYLLTLAKVGLSAEYLNMKAYELSGGEQQRVAIARLMLKPTKIILADEPTGSLDDTNARQMLSFLRQFAAEGKTVIMVTHSKNFDDYFDEIINLTSYN